jgi:hypothetical protein
MPLVVRRWREGDRAKLTIHAVPAEEREAYQRGVTLFTRGQHVLYGQMIVLLDDGARCEVRLEAPAGSRFDLENDAEYQPLHISRGLEGLGRVGDAFSK